MIIADNQRTKLVYNLVYRKDRGLSFQRQGYWSRFCLRFGCLLGVSVLLSTLVLGLAEAVGSDILLRSPVRKNMERSVMEKKQSLLKQTQKAL